MILGDNVNSKVFNGEDLEGELVKLFQTRGFPPPIYYRENLVLIVRSVVSEEVRNVFKESQ